jgi:hypothetical protein
MRFGLCWLVLTAILVDAWPRSALAEPAYVQEGRAGFVVSSISYALPRDAAETGACPQGLSRSLAEAFAQTPGGGQRHGEPEKDYETRVRAGVQSLSTAPSGQNLCMNPEAGGPDAYFRHVTVSNILVPGIDLDGQVSSSERPAAPGTCVHDDFAGVDGGQGIDNQFYRVVGCSRSFQSTGQSNTFATEMLTGSWGILLTVSGIDDLHNDDDVEVGFFANDDPIRLSPNREPLAYATYTAGDDPRFRAIARGHIRGGVLTTEPTDVRFHHVVNSMLLERPLRGARVRMTIADDGTLDGYLAGYTPVEEMYDMQYGYRNGKTHTGEIAPLGLRSGSANGAAFVLGHTCHGAYHALYQHADGHPDAATGKCTSISTQYRIKAIPAFVVENDAAVAGDRHQASGSGS